MSAPLRIRASRAMLTTLEILETDPETIRTFLHDQARQAPDLFRHMPAVLDLSAVETDLDPSALARLTEAVSGCGVRLAAVHTRSDDLRAAADALGLGDLHLQSVRDTTATPPAAPAPAAAEPVASKVITQPVRSGQQIYARGTDLIVLGPVSAGAELLADGHIHVYGPLRGRALAGVHGRSDARIFCQHLEAELVSIAGQYKISEDLQATQWKQPAQIRLEADRLVVSAL